MPLQYATPSLMAIATGIAGSAFASGTIASITLVTVPALRVVQNNPARSWQVMFKLGMNTMPKIAVTVALSYLYAAFETRNQGGRWQGFAAAAGLLVSIVPFTVLLMGPTNDALTAAAEGTKALGASQVTDLIHTWGLYNLGRSLLPLASTVTGFATFMSNIL